MATLVQTFDGDDPQYVTNPKTSRQKAMDAQLEYGQILVSRGMNQTHGVFIQQIRMPGVLRKYWRWALYVEEYESEQDGRRKEHFHV